MTARSIKLIDSSGRLVAEGHVDANEDRLDGRLDLRAMPPSLRQVFQEYEEIVNGQIFSLLDEMEERIHALALKVVLEGAGEATVEDLQLYPSTGLVSFKIPSSNAAASSSAS